MALKEAQAGVGVHIKREAVNDVAQAAVQHVILLARAQRLWKGDVVVMSGSKHNAINKMGLGPDAVRAYLTTGRFARTE